MRETAAGDLLLVARSPAGAEHVLEWEPLVAPPGRAAQAAIPAAPVVRPPIPPAGYTRSGKPLSAKQMEVRARWSESVSTHMQRKEAQCATRNAAAG